MKILHINSYALPLGGQERFVAQLANAQFRAGHSITIASITQPNQTFQTIPDVTTVELPALFNVRDVFIWPRSGWKKLRDAIHKADVVHIHNPLQPFTLIAFLLTPRSKAVLTMHGRLTDPRTILNTCYQLYKLIAMSIVNWRSKQTVCLAQSEAMYFKRWLGASANYTVIHNGVDVEFFTAPTKPTCKPLRVLFVGRYTLSKGFREYCAVADILPAAKFIFSAAGSGELRDSIRTERVRDLGQLSSQELRTCYTLTDIVALPSYAEAVPNVILEAMAMGKPVIATRVGGIPEYIQHKKSGLLITPHSTRSLQDALNWCSTHQAALLTMGQAGRSFVNTYCTWTIIADRYIKLYRNL